MSSRIWWQGYWVNGYPKVAVGEHKRGSSISGARQRVGSRVMTRLFEKLARPLATPQTPGAFLNGLRWMGIEIHHWEKMHFRQSPSISMDLLHITYTDAKLTHKKHKPMWLVWVGGTLPALDSVWHDYLRRFAVDHWNRLAKQRLHWTLPKLGTPQRCQRWSSLLPLMTWQLWLAREIVVDKPLPWQKPFPLGHLTPGRGVSEIYGGKN